MGHAAIPGFGLTKGLVVELLPFVPASSSGRLVGSLCLVDPAELASIWKTSDYLQHRHLMGSSFRSWIYISRGTNRNEHKILYAKYCEMQEYNFPLKTNGSASYFRGLDGEAICGNRRDSCIWQAVHCRWHFNLTEWVDWLLSQFLIRRIFLSAQEVISVWKGSVNTSLL